MIKDLYAMQNKTAVIMVSTGSCINVNWPFCMQSIVEGPGLVSISKLRLLAHLDPFGVHLLEGRCHISHACSIIKS